VHGINTDLERLQPVAVDHTLERECVAVRRDKTVEVRKCRRLARSEIGEQDAALFHHRIRFLLNVGAEIAVVGLGRRLKTLAIYVEQPAVKGATQAAILKPAICEIGAAVRTTPADQAVTAFVILENHQVFTEQPDGLHRSVARKLVDERRGLPVAPHQATRRRACAGPGDEIVLLRTQHGCPIPYFGATLYEHREGPEAYRTRSETAGAMPAAFQIAAENQP
jgi:hypothetical protein